jgi:hypothetical protein
VIKSLRISVPLSTTDPTENIFNFAKLKELHFQKLSKNNELGHAVTSVSLQEADKPVETPKNGYNSDDSDKVPTRNESSAPTKRRSRKFDPEMEYDYNDAFIDDSEMFIQETKGRGLAVPQNWDIGYFVYQGSVDSIFQNQYSE